MDGFGYGYANSRRVLIETAKLLNAKVSWGENMNVNYANINGIVVYCGYNGVEIEYKNYWMGTFNNPHYLAHKLTHKTVRF